VSEEPARLLVVDDDEAARFVKGQILRRAGFQVLEGATGADALTLVAAETPDVVVLDVNLPDISGLEVSRRLRTEHPTLPALQILQVSSTAVTPHDQALGLEQGADIYLTEPVAPEVLVAAVHALLRVRRAEARMAQALEREREARAEAEKAARLRDEFIATLSHELRTPLNAVMGWAWQLRHSSLSTDARVRALDGLERNARLQVQLISDLLDVSRIAKGKLLLTLTRFDMRDVVTDTIEALGSRVQEKGLHLEMRGRSATVIADYGRLQQIVNNLVTNAIQFTPPGGRIVLEMTVDGDWSELSVRDTGVGIEPAMLPWVFDQFQQGPGGQARKHGGLGLGLAVVRQLTELHDGLVSVESDGYGHGTSFRLRLPRELDNNGAGRREPALSGVRVGIAVTSDEHAEMLRAMLEASGAETREAGVGVDSETALAGCAVRVTDRAEQDPWCVTVTPGTSQVRLVRRIARELRTRGV